MTEKDATTEAANQAPETPPPPPVKSAQSSSSLPVLLSILAVLLAIVALAASLLGSGKIQVKRVDSAVNNRLGALENRLSHLESSLASERHDLMQAKLARLLTEVRDIAKLGDTKAKQEISRVENILSSLSTEPATRVKARVDLEHTGPVAKTVEPASPKTGNPQTETTQQTPQPETTQPASEQTNVGNQASSKPDNTEAKPALEEENAATPDTGEDTGAASPATTEK